MRVRNFLFHRVCNDADKLWPPIPPKQFEDIITYLKRNFHIVVLEELLTDPRQFKKSKSLATISFDDGYKDNLDYAAPILQKLNCPASFYVVTDCIDRNIPTWTFIVDYIFQHASGKQIELNFLYVPDEWKKIDARKELQKVKRLKPWMKSLSNGQRTAIVNTLVEQTKEFISIPRNLMMNWDEVRQLHTAGYVVSSHTHTHPMLAKLETEDELKDELLISYNKITEQLYIKPQTISYPMGSFDSKVENMARRVGYMYGLAVEQKFYNTKNSNQMAIPRVELYAEAKWKVHGRISGIYNQVKRLLQ